MHFARDETDSEFLVRRYRPGLICIGQNEYTRSLILSPGRILTDWTPQHPDELAAEHFDCLLELAPDVLLLGTGERLCFPPPPVTAGLLTRGIGVEVMDTSAACRTYNILLSEGRVVVAALLV